MKPIERLRPVADRLRGWAEEEESVRALFWMGSFARGCPGWESDLDAAAVLAPGVSASGIAHAIRTCFGSSARHCIGPLRNKLLLWIGDGLVKLEIALAAAPEDLAWAADALDVPPPRMVRVFARDGSTDALAERARRQLSVDPVARIDEEVEKFLEGFEACSAAHRRSDCYAFYFEYNLALHRLARLVQMARRGPERLYLPRQLTNRCLELDDRQRFIDLAAPMYLPEANAAKRRLLDRFLSVRDELAGVHALARSRKSIEEFARGVLERDALFNVRDVAVCMAPHVVPGQLFRAGTLTRWQNDPALESWLERNHIGLVVDLRAEGEGEPYSSGALGAATCLRLPIPRNDPPSAAPEDAPAAGDGRFRWMSAHRESLAAAIGAVANAASATVVHCHAGRDRTGCLVALIGMLIGAPADVIADDYEASGEGADRATIRRFIDRVDAAGGAAAFLTPGGLVDDDVARLRRKLVPDAADRESAAC